MQTGTNICTYDSWEELRCYFPENWRKIAERLQVMKGARKDKDLDNTMRVLMIYLSSHYSLKETVLWAKMAPEPLYTSSHVALRDRLIKFQPLFSELCMELLKTNSSSLPVEIKQLKMVDASDIKETGPTGSLWRLHYSFSLPDFTSDFMKVTAASGKDTGENLTQFPLQDGDHIIADRGYSRASGISHADEKNAKVCIRLNTGSLKLLDSTGKPLGLKSKLKLLKYGGDSAEWECSIKSTSDGHLIQGRICAIRKDEEQIAQTRKRIKSASDKKKKKAKSDTYFFNEYIIVFTTFEPELYPLKTILAIYRWRWQIELLFKRLKSLFQLGHIPTRIDESSKAWLYGKLFISLLIEHICRIGDGSFSPWREYGHEGTAQEPLETFCPVDSYFAAFTSSIAGTKKLDRELE